VTPHIAELVRMLAQIEVDNYHNALTGDVCTLIQSREREATAVGKFYGRGRACQDVTWSRQDDHGRTHGACFRTVGRDRGR